MRTHRIDATFSFTFTFEISTKKTHKFSEEKIDENGTGDR